VIEIAAESARVIVVVVAVSAIEGSVEDVGGSWWW
jgi:hypothetical protein